MKWSIALSALNILVSGATLAVVLVGGLKAKKEMDTMKTRTNESIGKIKTALNEIEL